MGDKCIILEFSREDSQVFLLIFDLFEESVFLFLDLRSIDTSIDVDIDSLGDSIGKSRSLLGFFSDCEAQSPAESRDDSSIGLDTFTVSFRNDENDISEF